jgi:hypothetical protein
VTGFLIVLTAAAVGGLIQRSRTSDEARWRYLRAWTCALIPCVGIVGGTVIVHRGSSKSSLALAGAGLVLIGSALCLLVEGERSHPAIDRDGWLIVAFRLARVSAGRASLCIVWWVVSVGYLLAALQYGGAFVREPALEKISAIAALGQFKPLRAYGPVDNKQCLGARDIGRQNEVVACSLPHRSEVVEEIDKDRICQSVDSYTGTGLDLKVVEAGPFDGSRFCVLQSMAPGLWWTGRVFPPQIASTT